MNEQDIETRWQGHPACELIENPAHAADHSRMHGDMPERIWAWQNHNRWWTDTRPPSFATEYVRVPKPEKPQEAVPKELTA